MQAVHVRDRCALGTDEPRPLLSPCQPSLAEWQSYNCSCPARVSRVLGMQAISPHPKRGMQAWHCATSRHAHAGAVLSAHQPSRSASV